MKPYQKFIAGAAVLGTLAGCAAGYNPTKSIAGGLEETVTGKVMGAKLYCTGIQDNNLSVLIKTNSGKYVLCSSAFHTPEHDLTEAYVLLESGMKDGTQVKIKKHRLDGWGKDGCFMDSVSMYGYTINTGL